MNCPSCKAALGDNDFTLCAMKVYACACGHEIELNVREAAEYLIALQTRIDELETELRQLKPFAGIDL